MRAVSRLACRTLAALPVGPLLLERLAAKELDHQDAGQALLQRAGQRGELALDAAPGRPHPAGVGPHAEDDQGQQAQVDQPQPPVPDQQHDEDAEQGQQVGQDDDRRPPEKVVQHIDVGRDPRHQVAGARPVVEGEGEAAEVLKDGVADLKDDALARVGRQIEPQKVDATLHAARGPAARPRPTRPARVRP